MLLHCYPCTMPLHNLYITHAATQLNNCIQLGLTFINTQHVSTAQYASDLLGFKHNIENEIKHQSLVASSYLKIFLK